jgi:hypothetical protein
MSEERRGAISHVVDREQERFNLNLAAAWILSSRRSPNDAVKICEATGKQRPAPIDFLRTLIGLDVHSMTAVAFINCL